MGGFWRSGAEFAGKVRAPNHTCAGVCINLTLSSQVGTRTDYGISSDDLFHQRGYIASWFSQPEYVLHRLRLIAWRNNINRTDIGSFPIYPASPAVLLTECLATPPCYQADCCMPEYSIVPFILYITPPYIPSSSCDSARPFHMSEFSRRSRSAKR